ncbi:unnamed protein product, partial [Ectocarpus fasciculatus]
LCPAVPLPAGNAKRRQARGRLRGVHGRSTSYQCAYRGCSEHHPPVPRLRQRVSRGRGGRRRRAVIGAALGVELCGIGGARRGRQAKILGCSMPSGCAGTAPSRGIAPRPLPERRLVAGGMRPLGGDGVLHTTGAGEGGLSPGWPP